MWGEQRPIAIVPAERQRLDGTPVGKRTGAVPRAWTLAAEAAFVAALLANPLGTFAGRGDQLKCLFVGNGTVLSGARFRAWYWDGQMWYCAPLLDVVAPQDSLALATFVFGMVAPVSGQYLWTLDDVAGGTATSGRFIYDVEKS